MKYTTPYFCTNVNNVRTPFFQILVRMFCKNVFFFSKTHVLPILCLFIPEEIFRHNLCHGQLLI